MSLGKVKAKYPVATEQAIVAKSSRKSRSIAARPKETSKQENKTASRKLIPPTNTFYASTFPTFPITHIEVGKPAP
jgi:hypothetical protein